MFPALRLKLPGRCEVCRSWHAGTLCNDCVARFAPPRPRCARCGLALPQPQAMCGECLREAPPFEHTVCALDYGFPWDRLISDFKFRGRAELAPALAELMNAALERAAPTPAASLVVPVPLAPRRLAERGFNQAWELARALARRRRLRAEPEALQRVLDPAHQATLSRAERQRNLRNAFCPRRPGLAPLAGAHVALVDDVMTTGATVHEAAAALRRGGAASVQVWVLARTPATAADTRS